MSRLSVLFVIIIFVCANGAWAESLRVGIDSVDVRYNEISTSIQDNNIEPALLTLLEKQLKQQDSVFNEFKILPVKDRSKRNTLLADKNVDALFSESAFESMPGNLVETLPLFTTHWRLVSLSGRLAQGLDFKNLNDERVIVVSDAPIEALKQRYPQVTIIVSASLGDAVTLLKAGAADGVFCREQAANVLSENIFPGQLQVYHLDSLITRTHLLMRNDNPAALAALNQAIQQLPQEQVNNIISRNFTVQTLMNIVPLLQQNHRNFDTAAVIVAVIALFLIGILFTQILRRKKVERRLKDAIKFWETLLNSLSTPVMVSNSAGVITHVNQALCQSLKIAPTAVIGTAVEHFNQQFFANPALDTAGLVQASIATEAQFFEGSYSLHNSQRSIAGWITPYSNTHLVPQGLVIGWYDMTERIRLEAQLAQALDEANAFSHEKSEFLARMSHEIRSPMNVIMGVLEIENQRINNSQSPISVAYNASRGLLRIIGDILDLSKIEAGEMKLKPAPVSLYFLLENAADAYQNLAERKGLRLDSDIESCFGQDYLLDEGKMVQILNNLLSNAVKYTQQGHIALAIKVIDLGDNTHQITISVSDSGIGIKASLLPGIIKPYRQISSATPDSTGLGLTICHQLVTLMGGKLDITSLQNLGSTFTVTLRCQCVAPANAPAMPPASSSDGESCRLWIIDDLPANLLVMKLQLTALGHQVITFDSAHEALEQLQQPTTLRPDMILTDCQMPGMSGYEFATQVRRFEEGKTEHLPIVGCTANAFSDEETKCISAGMDGHLTKPMTQSDLKNCLHEMLFNRHVDLSEVLSLASGQQPVIIKLIDELQKSSAEDLMLIEGAWKEDDLETMKSKIHRLKGNFALTHFEAGQHLCMMLETKLSHADSDIALPMLRLHHTTRQFIALLHNISRQK